MAYAAQLHKRRDVPPPHHWTGAGPAAGVPTGAGSPAGTGSSSEGGSGCASPTVAHGPGRKLPALPLGLAGYVNEAAKGLPPTHLGVFHLPGSRSSQSSGECPRPRRCASVDSALPLLEAVAAAPASTPPPPPPERSDSLGSRSSEAHHLRAAPWFQAGIPREIALEVLGREPEGSFMVRESTTKPGCYALSLRVPRDFQPSGIAHYLILRTAKGYKIKGFTKEFTSLTALITHHSVMPELLPVPLSLSRYNPSFPKSDSNKDSDSDPDYNTLADFRKMMADLNV